MTITLDIPQSSPSFNRLNGQHWSKIAKVRKEWRWLVRIARLNAQVFITPRYPKAHVEIERFGAKILDHDNFVAGCKALLDCLRYEGFIEDDSPEKCTCRYIQHRSKVKRTLIRIELTREPLPNAPGDANG
jgi:hypothetical protein